MSIASIVNTPRPSSEVLRLAHLLAGLTGADWRTCLKALRDGPDAIRTTSVREVIAARMADLNVAVGRARTEGD